MTDLGNRLRAARLRRRIGAMEDLIAQFEIAGTTYRSAENGRRRLNRSLLEKIAPTLDVSADFLEGGSASRAAEREVRDLALKLSQADGMGLERLGDAAGRLVIVRSAAGYKSAAAASSKFGWKPSTYSAHENRRKAIPIDRLVLYGLSFDADLDFLLFGDAKDLQIFNEDKAGALSSETTAEPGNAAAPNHTPYADLNSPDNESSGASMPVQLGWGWMSASKLFDDFFQLPVLKFTERGLERLAAPFSGPAEMFPSIVEYGRPAYVLVYRERLCVIGPQMPGPNDALVVLHEKQLRMDRRQASDERIADPLSSWSGHDRPVPLGTFVGFLSLELG